LITAYIYLSNGGALEHAQEMTARESPSCRSPHSFFRFHDYIPMKFDGCWVVTAILPRHCRTPAMPRLRLTAHF
jgi:hypothetical protein